MASQNLTFQTLMMKYELRGHLTKAEEIRRWCKGKSIVDVETEEKNCSNDHTLTWIYSDGTALRLTYRGETPDYSELTPGEPAEGINHQKGPFLAVLGQPVP